MPYGFTAWDVTQFDIDNNPCWVRDDAHGLPIHTPLYLPMFIRHLDAEIMAGYEKIRMPHSLGYYFKYHYGHLYLARGLPRPEQMPGREEEYRKRVAVIIDDPYGYIQGLIKQAEDALYPLNPLDPSQMEDAELLNHLFDCMDANRRACWAYFFGYPGATAPLLLYHQLMKEFWGMESWHPDYTKLIRGLPNRLYDSNAELCGLAAKAIELGVADHFKLPDKEVLPAMEQSDAGRQWLKAMQDYLGRFGMRVLRMYEICEPGWYEDPTLIFNDIRGYIELGGKHRADDIRPSLAEEREALTKEYLAKTPAEQRDMMAKLITAAQAANYFTEEFALTEMNRHALMRRAFYEIAKRMAQSGCIREPDDVFMLLDDEVIHRFIPRERGALWSLVEERRKEWEYYKSIIGGPEEQEKAPLLLGGKGMEALGEMIQLDPTLGVAVSMPIASPEEVGALCVGGAGAPGVVEGYAKVIFSEREWDKIEIGDILVTPLTSAVWTPLFGLISGVVCDSGGSLAHPVIVSREYNIPCVAGTLDATKKIKTGDKIRVDGNMLRVYLLERKE